MLATLVFIDRPRVMQLLATALQTPVTLLVAPLGYGKTSAVRSALGDDLRVVWFNLAAWRSRSYVSDFIDAVREVAPEYGDVAYAMAEVHEDGTLLAQACCTDAKRLAQPLTVVIDNIDELDADVFLRGLIESAPPTMRLVCISRTRLSWDITRLIVQGRMTTLDAQELAFDEEECSRFLQAYGREKIRADIDGYAGWPAALSLFVRSADDEFSAHATPERLAQSFLTALPEPVQQVLELRIIADWMERTADEIELFDRYQTHVRSADGAMHARPFLAAAVHATLAHDAARRRARHHAASMLAQERQQWHIALYHAEQSGADDVIALAAHFPEEIAALGMHASLSVRLERERIDTTLLPRIFYFRALLAQQRGTSDIDALLDEAERLLPGSTDTALASTLRLKRVEIALCKLQPVNREEVSALRNLVDAQDTRSHTRISLYLAWSYALDGDFAQARASLTSVDLHDILVAHDVTMLLAYVYTGQSEFREAQRVLDGMMERLEDRKHVVLQARLLVWYARLALLWGDTLAAYDTASEAWRLAGMLALDSHIAVIAATHAAAASHLGDADAIEGDLASISSFTRGAWYLGDVVRLPILAKIYLARAAFLRDDLNNAVSIAASAVALGTEQSVQRLLAETELRYYNVLLGRASESTSAAMFTVHDLADVRDAADARILAGLLGDETPLPDDHDLRMLVSTMRNFAPTQEAVTQIARACVALAQGGAHIYILFTIALVKVRCAGRNDLLRIFEHVLQPAATAFVPSCRLLAEPRLPRSRCDDLTEREHEILELLVQGWTNKEIADRLVLSPRTVESHVEKVLAKLEVASRARAVAKAIRLGLVVLADE